MSLDASRHPLRLHDFRVAPTIAQVIADERYRAIAVDIPIGLLDEHRPGGRLCDLAARLVVGMRITSVFTPPARIALGAESYEAAKRLCSMSRQSYGLLKKIAELDALVTPAMQSRVFETHPEVAFAALARRPWLSSKKTAEGRGERIAILSELVPDTPRLSRRRERLVGVDDVLDATVAAVVAARRYEGHARRLPEIPAVDSRGLRMEIWY